MKFIIIFILILLFILKFLNYKKISKFSNINKNILIVGNAPIKYKNIGNIINNFDIVVRFNDFNIEEFKNDIGNKIDYWIIFMNCTYSFYIKVSFTYHMLLNS